MRKERANDSKIIIIGYSQGTTVSTYALATQPDYFKDKVSLFVAIGPSVFFKQAQEPLYRKLAG
jgi:predicted esterase